MPQVLFVYKKKETIINCGQKEKMENICKKFASKIKKKLSELCFIYNDMDINQEYTYELQISDEDKNWNIFVVDVEESNNNKDTQINHKFIKNPNFKYKFEINKSFYPFKLNDIFEVFISFKDKKEYIATPNFNYEIDIFSITDNKKILSIKGQSTRVSLLKYYINNKDKNEYLVTADEFYSVFIWDITDNYNLKHKINVTFYCISSCLLVFPHFMKESYLLVSSSNYNEKSNIKIYSLNNGTFLKYLNNADKTYFLLLWYNMNNSSYYIIHFEDRKIVINNLLKEELYLTIEKNREEIICNGFIFNKNNNDYLFYASTNGIINIWELFNKKNYKTFEIKVNYLYEMIEWNNKYCIIIDNNNSIIILDIENNIIISKIIGKDVNNVKSIKKIYHQIYGESLLTGHNDNSIKLWNI